MAFGVISKKLRLSPIDLMDLRDAVFNEEEIPVESLLQRIGQDGFDVVANEVEEWWWTQYRPNHPSTRFKGMLVDHPIWKFHILSFCGQVWRFRNQLGPVNQILDRFEECNWPPCIRIGLPYPSVSSAARYLREKTEGYIKWPTSSDPTIGWQRDDSGIPAENGEER